MKTIEEMIDVRANEFAEREYEVGDIDRDALRKGYYWGAKDTMSFALSHQWRSVEDELPEKDVLVLVRFRDGDISTARHSGQGWRVAGYNPPTHWMPIPSLNPEQR